MRFAVVFLAFLVVSVNAGGNPIKPSMYCPICEFLVQVLMEEGGDLIMTDESKVIAECDKLLGTAPGSGTLGDLICGAFVKDELDNIVKQLENTDNEIKDAKGVCLAAKICTADGTGVKIF